MTNHQASSKLKQFDDSVDTKKETKRSKKKTLRGNVFEVCEDLDAFDTVPDFDKCAESTGADQYAWLVHGCDTYGEDDLKALQEKGLDMTKYQLGAPKNDHVHVVLRFKNPVTLPKIAKAFGVPEQNVQRWTGANAWGNAVSYLTHRTAGAEEKYQYDPSDVHANFDYVKKLAEVTQKVEVASARLSKKEAKSKLAHLEDLYKTGQMSFTEFKHQVASDPMILGLAAKKKREIDAMHEFVSDQEIGKFFNTFTQARRVIWLYGDTGSGKSLTAKYIAKHFAKKRFPSEPPRDNSYQVLGSSRGPLEQYLPSVHCIVLDDFRPSAAFTVDDLFRNLDDHSDGATTFPGRYHDIKLAVGIVIITSAYNPAEFSYRYQKVWTAIQEQRYKLMQDGIYIEDCCIDEYDFDDIVGMYVSGDSSRYLEKGKDTDEMRKYYARGYEGVTHFVIEKKLNLKAKETGQKLDAIQLAQLRPVRSISFEGPEAIRDRYRLYPWNTCDRPSQIMRRSTVYKVSRDADDAVLFQHMRPVEHDNGYCEYVKDPSDPHLSLEEVWEGKSLDFNPDNPSPYNPFSSEFSLDYEDQTLSEDVDFMLRCRKSYLYIHGGAPSRYLDDYHDPEIEVKEVYDEQALDAVLKKVKEQVDAM